MRSEMTCPFCQARRPVTSWDDLFPLSVTVTRDSPPAAGRWVGEFELLRVPLWCGGRPA